MRARYDIHAIAKIKDRLVIIDGHYSSHQGTHQEAKTCFEVEVKLGGKLFLVATNNDDEFIVAFGNGSLIQGILPRAIPDPQTLVTYIKEVTGDLMALDLH